MLKSFLHLLSSPPFPVKKQQQQQKKTPSEAGSDMHISSSHQQKKSAVWQHHRTGRVAAIRRRISPSPLTQRHSLPVVCLIGLKTFPFSSILTIKMMMGILNCFHSLTQLWLVKCEVILPPAFHNCFQSFWQNAHLNRRRSCPHTVTNVWRCSSYWFCCRNNEKAK